MSNTAWVNTVKKNHFHSPSQSLERIMSPYWVGIMSRSQPTMEQGPCCCLLMAGGTIMGMNVLILPGAYFLLETDLAAHLGCFQVLESKSSIWTLCLLICDENLLHWDICWFQVSSWPQNNSSPTLNITVLISVPSLDWIIKRIQIQILFMPTSTSL